MDKSLRRHLLFWTVLSIASVIFYGVTKGRVSPEAALPLEITAEGAVRKAGVLLERFGVNVEGYHHAITFGTDSEQRDYLAKHLPGLQDPPAMFRAAGIWSWQVRYYKPHEKRQVL